MKPLFIFAPLSALIVATAAAVEPKPGETVDFPIGDMVHTAKLYTPKSWRKGSKRPWPIFLYYHGTGGRPSLELAKRYGGDDAFFLVGMGYSIRGPITAADHDRYNETEKANLIAVRDALAEHGGHPKRVYVGGFSKGGWMASHFADREPRLIAGAVILGAGRNPFRLEDLPNYPNKLPIYIGVGTNELNYQLGHAGIDHWGKRGATVTFDPYLGVGHAPPLRFRSEYLHQWFQIESLRDRKTLLRPIFTRWHDGTRAAAKADPDPVTSYLMLSHMAGAPLAIFLNREQRKALSADIAKLREHPRVKKEVGQRALYRPILDKEVLGGFRLRVWIDVIDDYVRIYENAPETPTGKRAIADAARLLHSIRTGVRAEKKAMVDSFLSTHQALVDKIDSASVDDLNRELRELDALLNEARSAE
jgi:predicted esterase